MPYTYLEANCALPSVRGIYLMCGVHTVTLCMCLKPTMHQIYYGLSALMCLVGVFEKFAVHST